MDTFLSLLYGFVYLMMGPAPDPNSAAIYYQFYISTYLNL